MVKLAWNAPESGAIAGYDIYRADDGGTARCTEAVKGRRHIDRNVLGGLSYTYYVRAFDAQGRASAPSNAVTIEPKVPSFADPARNTDRETLHA